MKQQQRERMTTFDKWLWSATAILLGLMALGYVLKATGLWRGF